MVRLDRACSWLFIICFILLVPSSYLVKFTDELCACLLVAFAALDCLLNGNWRRYNLLWFIIALMTFYAVYSLMRFNFNTPRYIMTDWLIQLKPYLAFTVMLAVRPVFTPQDKGILKIAAVVNVLLAVLALSMVRIAGNHFFLDTVFFHVMTAGMCIYISAVTYLLCSIKDDGSVDIRAMGIFMLMLILGLMCTRSKYYGEFVVTIYFIYIYRYGMMKAMNFKYAFVIASVMLLFIAVSWGKIEYYFLKGNSDTFDSNVIESYARPVMYVTSGLVLVDFFPFGSGLASFGSFASSDHYSRLYFDYGLDKIHGLSPQMPDFICDAFYPSLAQFGFVGWILFIWFWIYIYRYLKNLIRFDNIKNKYYFCIGVALMCFIFIESVASTIFVQFYGLMAMMLLGMICAQGAELMEQQEEKVIDNGKI